MAGTKYVDLDCQMLPFIPWDCTSWIFRRKADGTVNIFEVSRGLFPLITGQDPLFEADLDWLKFTYTVYQVGAYVAPASTVLN